MPADDTCTVKQYPVTMVAGQSVIGVTPARSPNDKVQRTYLMIQNTAGNPAQGRWENAVQLDGGDFTIAPFATMEFKHPCPRERLSVFSVLGTTLAIVEGLSDG